MQLQALQRSAGTPPRAFSISRRFFSAALLLASVLHFTGSSALAETWLILPFVNQTGNSSLDWIGESIIEPATGALFSRGEMVISREDREEAESRLALRPRAPWTIASIVKLGETLDAQRLAYGSYTLKKAESTAPSAGTAGSALGTLQFELRVVSLREFSSAEVKLIAGPLETLAQLESRLAWHILASSRLRNIPLENDFLAAQTPVNIRALESFTRGLLAATPTAQRTLWEKALEIEPTFSAAAFRLGKLQLDQENYAAAAGYLSRVRKGDWHYWQAQFLLGLAHYQNNAFLAASRAFASVVKELPLPEATNNLALAQFRAASPDAKDSMLRSLDGDDRDPHYHFNLGILLAANAEWLLAAEQFRATLARLPEDAEATKMLGRCLKPPPAVTPQMRAEWASLLRLKWELNEFAFRQLQFLLTEKLDAL